MQGVYVEQAQPLRPSVLEACKEGGAPALAPLSLQSLPSRLAWMRFN